MLPTIVRYRAELRAMQVEPDLEDLALLFGELLESVEETTTLRILHL